jgi:hypothetical protein
LGFSSHGFDTRGCFLGGFSRSRLGDCCGSRRRLFGLGRLPGGGHVRWLGSLIDRLRIWDCRWSGGFDNTPPSDDVAPTLAYVHLLGRGPGLRGVRGGRVASGGVVTAKDGRLLCNRRLRLLPLYTATLVLCVVSPAATAQRMSPRGRASTGEVGAPTRDASWRVTAVALRVSKALAAFALQRSLWCQVRLHRHSQTAELGD